MSIFSRHFCRTTVCWHNDFWKWRNDRRSERNLCNCVKKKNSGLQRGLNPWPRDTGAMLYQLSYEATDVGSGSILGSYVPVKEMSVNDIWYMPYMNCGNEMKMKKWWSKWTQFMQLRKEAWKKIQNFNDFTSLFKNQPQIIKKSPRVLHLLFQI